MSRIRSLARISDNSTVFPLPESNNNVGITGVAAHTFEPVAEEKAEVMNRSLSPRVSQKRQDTSINMPANSVSKSVLLTDYSFIDLYPPPKNDYQLH